MTSPNRYFEFDEPIRWFEAVGMSPSNTYIGASRAIRRVHRPTTVEPGDQVHALVGGTFVVRKDGHVESGCLRLPKPLLEKNYGLRQSDAELLGLMAKAGRCREVAAPGAKPDYLTHRDEAHANGLPEHLGHVLPGNHPPSPLLLQLVEGCVAGGLGTETGRGGAKIMRSDVGMGREPDSLECSVILEFPDRKRLTFRTGPATRDVWLLDDDARFGAALDADAELKGSFPYELRNDMVTIVPFEHLDRLADAVCVYASSGRTFEASEGAPAPR